MTNVEFLKVDIYYVHTMNLYYLYQVFMFIEIQQRFRKVYL